MNYGTLATKRRKDELMGFKHALLLGVSIALFILSIVSSIANN